MSDPVSNNRDPVIQFNGPPGSPAQAFSYKSKDRMPDLSVGRKRRVKCDENRPCCNKCDKNALICQGYGYGVRSTDDRQPRNEVEKLPETQQNNAPSTSQLIRVSLHSSTDDDQIVLSDSVDARPAIPQNILAWTRADPFDTFCVKSTPVDQKVFDHSIVCQWSRFAPSQGYGEIALVKKHVMSYVINNPVSYHSLLYAGACHKNFWQKSIVRGSEYDTELLWLKTKAIKAMRHAIVQSDGGVTDDVLIAALMLAVFDTGDKVRRRAYGKVQERKALSYKLDAEFYAALDVEWKHLNVFYDLVEKRGGILTMQPSALRTSAIMFDVFNAYIHLSRPRMPALWPLKTSMAMRTWRSDSLALHTASELCQGFDRVFNLMQESPETKILRQVIDGSVLVMLDFEQIERSKQYASLEVYVPNEQAVIWVRQMLLHELLMLPERQTPIPTEGELPTLIYELCRLSLLLFCQVWLLADNNQSRRMARSQVSRLLPLLERATTGEPRLCAVLPDFYLWIMILGLMLAYEDLDIAGDRTCLEMVAPFVAHSMVKTRSEAWIIVRDVLPQFIWSWNGCDLTGREAWKHGCEVLNTS